MALTKDIQAIQTVSLEKAKQLAPAIFATSPADYIKTDKGYTFTPTTEIIEHMSAMGYQLSNVKQSSTKVELRRNYGTHIVEFQHPDLFIKDSEGTIEARPTVIVLNSHDGSRPLQFEMGLFRLVCSNGLVVKDKDMGGFRERHTRYDLPKLKSLIDAKVESMNTVVAKINQWNQLEMRPMDRKKFATDALLTRISSDRQPEEYEILDILQAKRPQDEPNTLWHVYNRVQENLIKGGFMFNERSARAITNPIEDMRINQELWTLADAYTAS